MAWIKRLSFFRDLRTVSFVAAVILAIPGMWKGLTGFHMWLSPFVMLNSVFAVKTFVLLNVVAGTVLLFILFRRRWFCRNLCPAGWCFDRISSLNKSGSKDYSRIPDLGKWMAIISLAASFFGLPLFILLDPLALFNGFFTVLSGGLNAVTIVSLTIFPVILILHFFLPGIWCSRLCPLGGLQTAFFDIKVHLSRLFSRKEQEIHVDYSGRRYFLLSGAGLLAGLTLPKLLKPRSDSVIRPPGAVEPRLFTILCCRCGSCIKACPTGILKPNSDFSEPLVWMTPVASFKKGYCLETCNLCSRVCSSGAITQFSTDTKRRLYMGTAEIDLGRCYLSNNRECNKCKESCPYSAISFIRQDNLLNTLPVIEIGRCVGCGACEAVCPAECIHVKPVNS